MKNAAIFVLALSLFAADSVAEEEKNLVSELESLNAPANEMPGAIGAEKIYSVQTRFSPLKHRGELTAGAGQKVSDTGFMSSRDLGLGARFYLDSKWSIGAAYSFVSNQFTDTAQRLLDKQGIVADLPYVKSRAELTGRYNLFYGKFRLSMDKVLYFDHYVSAGPAMIQLSNGSTVGGVIDTGLAFWYGASGSLRIGIKDYLYNENSLSTPATRSLRNNVLVYLDLGFLFGKGV